MKRTGVSTALEEVIRMRKIQNIPQFFGSRIWEGDLSRMREDQPPRPRDPLYDNRI